MNTSTKGPTFQGSDILIAERKSDFNESNLGIPAFCEKSNLSAFCAASKKWSVAPVFMVCQFWNLLPLHLNRKDIK